jgi:hypothetical protein
MKQLHSAKAALAALGLAVLVFTVPANAETYMRVNIPFEFIVGSQSLPAGTYTIVIDANFSLSHIDSVSDGAWHRVYLKPGTARPQSTNPDVGVVQFKKYGERYFLSAIWKPGVTDGLAAISSGRLKELARSNGASKTVSIDADTK